MKSLLVIDMQNICVGENHAACFQYQNEELIVAVNQAIDANKGNLVIYIRNLMKRNIMNKLAPFQAYEGSTEAEFVRNLHIVSDLVFVKYTGNAFSNKALNEFLRQEGVDTVEIVGVDGGGCVSLTALGAIKNGCQVIMNTKAIGTMFTKKKEKYFKKLKEEGADFI